MTPTRPSWTTCSTSAKTAQYVLHSARLPYALFALPPLLHPQAYFKEVNSRLDNNIAIAVPIRGRILAACWGAGEADAFDDLMEDATFMDAPVLAKALSLLDGVRAARALLRRMNRSALQRRAAKGHFPLDALRRVEKPGQQGAAAPAAASSDATPINAYDMPSSGEAEATATWGPSAYTTPAARRAAVTSARAMLKTGRAAWRAERGEAPLPGDDDDEVHVTADGSAFVPASARAVVQAAVERRPGALSDVLTTLAPEEAGLVSMRPASAAYSAAARSRHHILLEASENSRTVTSSLCKRVCRWAAAVPRERLEYLLLQLSAAGADVTAALSVWRDIFKIAHVKPANLALPYFAAVVFTGMDAVPQDSVVRQLETLSPQTLTAMTTSWPEIANMYSFVHRKVDPAAMHPATKAWFAAHAPLGEVLWWYEELHCPGAEAAVMARLGQGDVDLSQGQYDINFGKLMERYLEFTSRGYAFASLLAPFAEQQLTALAAASPKRGLRVAVLGDASGSMEVAIRTASILGSLLSVVLDARLDFFDEAVRPSPLQPRSAADVLKVSTGTPATGTTAPAAGLRKYYDEGTPIDLFVMVTDEEENGTSQGSSFAQLFRQYRKDVHAGARVFFVSFLPTSVTTGPMQVSLAQLGIPSSCFRLDGNRPDLTKMSSMLGQLYTLSEEFEAVPSAKAPPSAPSSSSGPGKVAPTGHESVARAASAHLSSDAHGAATARRGGRALGTPRPATSGATSAAPAGTAPTSTSVAAAAAGGGGSGPPAEEEGPVAAAATDNAHGKASGALGEDEPEPEPSAVMGPGESEPSASAESQAEPELARIRRELEALKAENARLRRQGQ